MSGRSGVGRPVPAGELLLAPDVASRAEHPFDAPLVLRRLCRERAGVTALGPPQLAGGIRRGTDVVKALAYGAGAVLVGRPYLYGLAVAGDEPVLLPIV